MSFTLIKDNSDSSSFSSPAPFLLLRNRFFFLFCPVLLLPLFSGVSGCCSSFLRQWFLFLFSWWFVVVTVVLSSSSVVVPLVFLIAFEVSESFSLAFLYCIVVFCFEVGVCLCGCWHFMLFEFWFDYFLIMSLAYYLILWSLYLATPLL